MSVMVCAASHDHPTSIIAGTHPRLPTTRPVAFSMSGQHHSPIHAARVRLPTRLPPLAATTAPGPSRHRRPLPPLRTDALTTPGTSDFNKANDDDELSEHEAWGVAEAASGPGPVQSYWGGSTAGEEGGGRITEVHSEADLDRFLEAHPGECA